MTRHSSAAREARRVLVVDDDLDTAQSMAVMLRELGHQVEFAINGRAALELARKLRPQILFIDMVLPDFDGSHLSRLLRKQLEPDKPCVVIITDAAGEEARTRALDAGCDEFFLKPVDRAKLDRVLSA